MNAASAQWRVLNHTIAEARAGIANLPPETVEALVDEAVTAARETRETAPGKVT